MPDDDREIPKPRSSLESLNFCVEGILYAFKSEKHIRYHFVTAVFVLILSLLLKLPTVEFALYTIAIVILLFAEMINTALEEVVNMVVGDTYSEFAKNAKDIAAGAVLIASFGVIIMTYMIMSIIPLRPIRKINLLRLRTIPDTLAFISLLLVLILVVVVKAFYGKGKPLHGGASEWTRGSIFFALDLG